MEEQEQLSLAQLLPKIMEEAGYIQKQGKVEMGGGRGYKFASLEQVLDKVRAAMVRHGVFIHASTNTSEPLLVVNPVGSDGKPKATQFHAVSHVSITFGRHGGLGKIELAGPYEGTGSGADTGDKAVMKANSSAMKYALQKAFLISWGDDPEADPSLYEEEKPAKKAPAKAKAADKAPETPAETKSTGGGVASDLLSRIRSTKTQNDHELLKAEISVLRIKNKAAYTEAVALWESEGKARGLIPAQQ